MKTRILEQAQADGVDTRWFTDPAPADYIGKRAKRKYAELPKEVQRNYEKFAADCEAETLRLNPPATERAAALSQKLRKVACTGELHGEESGMCVCDIAEYVEAVYAEEIDQDTFHAAMAAAGVSRGETGTLYEEYSWLLARRENTAAKELYREFSLNAGNWCNHFDLDDKADDPRKSGRYASKKFDELITYEYWYKEGKAMGLRLGGSEC